MSNYDIDLNKLADYLEENIAGFIGPVSLEKFAGGQSNPTFKVTAESGIYVFSKQHVDLQVKFSTFIFACRMSMG